MSTKSGQDPVFALRAKTRLSAGVRHRKIVAKNPALIVAVALAIAACGISYSIEPARLLLTDSETVSRQKVLSAVSAILQRHGFDDLGTDEEMIALMERSQAGSDWLVSDLRNTFTYLNDQRKLRVVVKDYSDQSRKRSSLAFEAPAGPFFELSVYEERPGGFSIDGHRFVSTFREEVDKALNTSVTMATPPRATDEEEFWRVTIANGFALLTQWTLAFLITITITGALTLYVLRRLSAPRTIKRSVFVLVNAWLATPLPFPVATILVAFLPNLLAFPWTHLDYYHRVQDVALISFPISLVLCFLISLRVFPTSNGEASDA